MHQISILLVYLYLTTTNKLSIKMVIFFLFFTYFQLSKGLYFVTGCFQKENGHFYNSKF